MSTTSDSQFQTDRETLIASAQEVQQQIEEAEADQSSYKARLGKLSSNPELALMQLFFILYASPGDNTAGGGVQDQIGITGARLKLNGALTTVGNDLQNMVNGNSSNPGDLKTFADDASWLKWVLNPAETNLPLDGTPYAGQSNPFYQDPSNPSMNVMDSEAQESVEQTISTIRSFFDISNAAIPSDNGPLASSYFADQASDPNHTKIWSFSEYQYDLSQQGDINNSTEAAKALTDDFGTNTQTTQTTSAVINNDMKTYSSLLQAIQQFDSAIAEMMNAVKKQAITSTASGS